MKKLVLLFTLLLSIAASAQQEGIVHYTRTTYWTKMINQLTFLSKQEKERNAYMWGGRDDWKEYMVLYFNDKSSKYTYSDEKSAESSGYDWRKEQYVVKRDFEKNTMVDIIEMVGKTYIIEDSLGTQNWKIMNDLKDVAGHICMKAMKEDTVKKQKIVAWFAQDIPSNIGPERSYGLPGMILALDINDGTVTIEASRIENKKLTQELDLPKKMKGTKLTETAYENMLDKFIKEKIKEERNPYWMIRY
ncbi:GLPGLI family protein [Cytophagaceae bacterium DM2B3-1]|uniref:GLPGLI family protein n=1 Tax=Xanthocytophaga flava TaxID=3048013 RepID=A0ABT7CNX4_9BACT|nr:GLPGLI family protein [Xanthocytophaga flavus]MDJ1469867.1 GLPGLI family protein [Xanthocytophaga flavus]MDJ1494379.1 GLPGLI family protein [Xanthocytophaga flavus]